MDLVSPSKDSKDLVSEVLAAGKSKPNNKKSNKKSSSTKAKEVDATTAAEKIAENALKSPKQTEEFKKEQQEKRRMREAKSLANQVRVCSKSPKFVELSALVAEIEESVEVKRSDLKKLLGTLRTKEAELGGTFGECQEGQQRTRPLDFAV